jgi:hypothetical protein
MASLERLAATGKSIERIFSSNLIEPPMFRRIPRYDAGAILKSFEKSHAG